MIKTKTLFFLAGLTLSSACNHTGRNPESGTLLTSDEKSPTIWSVVGASVYPTSVLGDEEFKGRIQFTLTSCYSGGNLNGFALQQDAEDHSSLSNMAPRKLEQVVVMGEDRYIQSISDEWGVHSFRVMGCRSIDLDGEAGQKAVNNYSWENFERDCLNQANVTYTYGSYGDRQLMYDFSAAQSIKVDGVSEEVRTKGFALPLNRSPKEFAAAMRLCSDTF